MKNSKKITSLLAMGLMTFAGTNTFAQLACNDVSRNLSTSSSVINCTGYLYDSGGPTGNYGHNEDNSIIINPIDATSITLHFSAFNTELNYDWVEIYNTVSSGLPLYRFSGTTVPSDVTISGDVMRIRFYTDASFAYSGFAANWVATGGSCGSNYNIPASVISAKGKVFDSGGPTGNYGNNETKIFNIEPTNATTVCISFYGLFGLENNYDFLKVYKGLNGTNTLLGTFTGSTLPPNITSTSGTMSLVFTSDFSNVGTGFNAVWDSDGDYPAFAATQESRIISTEDVDSYSKISIYPNPTNSTVSIGFDVLQEGQTKVIVYNAAGMETVILNESLAKGKHTIDFDASVLTNGVYFCKVITNDNVRVEKLVKSE